MNDYLPTMTWRNPTFDRPEVRKNIIILTESHRVMRGYMAATTWNGEENLTYSFHGEYFDFEKGKLTYCLENCLAWMDLPDMPEVHSKIEARRRQALE